MAWVTTRKVADGSTKYLAGYRHPSGRQRSAGTFRKRVEAERAAHAADYSRRGADGLNPAPSG